MAQLLTAIQEGVPGYPSHGLQKHIALSLAAHIGGTTGAWSAVEQNPGHHGGPPILGGPFRWYSIAHSLRLCSLEPQPQGLWEYILTFHAGMTRKHAVKRAREATCPVCLVLLDEILAEVER